jgi:phage terminase large subunit-like protein
MREEVLASIGRRPGALSDVRYDWDGFWAREDQLVSVEELDRYPLIVFGGIRGTGKTRAAVQLFLREILAGRVRRPRIIAATDSDVKKTVVFGESGIMSCLPRAQRPVWLQADGFAGVLRFRNGIEVLCFSAKAPEQLVGQAGDFDLMDDVAKWGPQAEAVFRHCRTSCRIGNRNGIMATTRRGMFFLRRVLNATEMPGVLVRRPADARANANNLSAGYFGDLESEIGGDTDFFRQELNDEDVVSAPFGDVDFTAHRVAAAPFEQFLSVAVWVDPSVSSSTKRCECGIVVAGLTARGSIYLLEDLSGVHGVDSWPDIAVEALERWAPRAAEIHLGVETNRGDMMPVMLLKQAEVVRRLTRGEAGISVHDVRPVRTDKSKADRAHPLPRLYRAGRVFHVGRMEVLEKQLHELDDTDKPNRDRADAAVYAMLDLSGQLDLARPGVPIGGTVPELEMGVSMGPAPLGSVNVGVAAEVRIPGAWRGAAGR